MAPAGSIRAPPGTCSSIHNNNLTKNLTFQLKLVNPSAYRFEHLVTQMKWRLEEGQGEAIYEIGVEDNGLLVGLSNSDLMASVHNLERMAEKYVYTIHACLITLKWNLTVRWNLTEFGDSHTTFKISQKFHTILQHILWRNKHKITFFYAYHKLPTLK